MKLLLIFLLLFPVLLFAQTQVSPPNSGWTEIYDDTLRLGTREAKWSFGDDTGAIGVDDTTKPFEVKNLWGWSTLAINIDLQNISKTADSLDIRIAGYRQPAGQIQQFYDEIGGTSFTMIDTLDRINVADGEYYINLSYLGNQTWWTKQEHVLFFIGGNDTMRIRLYILRD